MTNMKQYLAWIKQNQQNNPEWQAANRWQNRNQTTVNPPKSSGEDKLPEGTEVIEEKPEE
jgi:hypothetical protein